MNESARDFPEALNEAKSNGFAESDPSLDINGIDACYKLCIILFHSFGLLVKPSTIFTKGITQINTFDMEFARKNNAVIKLLAKAGKKGDQINAWCIPAFVSEGSVLSQTHNEYNSVVLETAFTATRNGIQHRTIRSVFMWGSSIPGCRSGMLRGRR